MKKVLMLTLALTMCSGVAMADHIGIYGDQSGSGCVLTLAGLPNMTSAYIVHKYSAGSTASQFKVTDASSLTAANQVTPFLMLGTWNTDLSLAYGSCLSGDILLMTLNFFYFGQPTTCANTLEIVPAPTAAVPGAISIVDCATPSGNLYTANGGRAFTVEGCPSGCGEIATAEKTWGGVKALYR